MILVHPPVSKPSEPPPGIARLSGALAHQGIRTIPLDLNLECLLNLMGSPIPNLDRWTSRASRNLGANLDSVRREKTYGNIDRYKRSVMDLNRLLEMAAIHSGHRISLTNFQHESLAPTKSLDLIRAAEKPQENPFYPYYRHRLSSVLEKGESSFVGFSLNFLSQALCTFSMLGFLRREYPQLKLILGGGLVTSWMRRPDWNNPFAGLVDYLVEGAGEIPLLSILGVASPSSGHFTPDYEPFPLGDYLSPGPILPYSSSTGCYWNKCAFCPERAEQNPYNPVPLPSVQEDLASLTRQSRPVLIHMLDNALTPSLMRALSDDPPGVPWYGFARFTHHLADEDFCSALKQSGCLMLKLGLESGDQEVLDQEGKGVDLEVASKVLRSLHKTKIATYIYLLFGTPAESLKEARKTLEYTVRHSEAIDFLNLAIFNLPTYGPETKDLQTSALCEGDLSLYRSFSHPKGWNRGVVRQYLDKEFKRHPAIGKILRNDPPLFTSNHASFFCQNGG